MSETLERVKELVRLGQWRVSDHGDEELEDDRISAQDAVVGLEDAEVLEEYPDTGRGPSILTLQQDREHQPIHVVWGIAYNKDDGPAILVTAYRPDPDSWSSDFRERHR